MLDDDEVDLPPLKLRIKTGGGTGGHNGLKSLDAHFGAENTNYHRIRIGVGKSAHGETADHVLSQFNDEEIEALNAILDPIRNYRKPAFEFFVSMPFPMLQGMFDGLARALVPSH